MTRLGFAFAGLVVLSSLAACAAPSAAPTVGPSPTAVGGADFFLPEGCAVMDIRGPDGTPVDLTGRWIETEAADVLPSPPPPTDWRGEWIRQTGDCIRGIVVTSIPVGLTQQPDLYLWVARLDPALAWRLDLTRITSTDPITASQIWYSAVGWDDAGRMLICSAQSSGVVEDCPTVGPGANLEYRVEDLEGGTP